ncbi:hypothetical protein [Cohnella soli]|uniref:Uncharacterized protein n=1 Tax=Cohnella soli TaxID=425005 RepID=A0ABW0HXX0_9BACL
MAAIRSANARMTKESARKWVGKPVLIELKNGNRYIGWVAAAESGRLIVSGRKIPNRRKRGTAKVGRYGKARVSAFLPGMIGSALGGGSLFGGGFMSGLASMPGVPSMLAGGSLFGKQGKNPAPAAAPTDPAGSAAAGASAAGGAGFGDFLNMMGKALPMMKMGYGMIKTIMPMMQGLGG